MNSPGQALVETDNRQKGNCIYGKEIKRDTKTDVLLRRARGNKRSIGGRLHSLAKQTHQPEAAEQWGVEDERFSRARNLSLSLPCGRAMAGRSRMYVARSESIRERQCRAGSQVAEFRQASFPLVRQGSSATHVDSLNPTKRRVVRLPCRVMAATFWSSRRAAVGPAPAKKKMVGATGFEPATASSQSWCSTKLSYAPTTAASNIRIISSARNAYFARTPQRVHLLLPPV